MEGLITSTPRGRNTPRFPRTRPNESTSSECDRVGGGLQSTRRFPLDCRRQGEQIVLLQASPVNLPRVERHAVLAITG